jgi:hypothetical protein
MLLKEMRMPEHSGSQLSELRLNASSLGEADQLVSKAEVMTMHYNCPAGRDLAASYPEHTVQYCFQQ